MTQSSFKLEQDADNALLTAGKNLQFEFQGLIDNGVNLKKVRGDALDSERKKYAVSYYMDLPSIYEVLWILRNEVLWKRPTENDPLALKKTGFMNKTWWSQSPALGWNPQEGRDQPMLYCGDKQSVVTTDVYTRAETSWFKTSESYNGGYVLFLNRRPELNRGVKPVEADMHHVINRGQLPRALFKHEEDFLSFNRWSAHIDLDRLLRSEDAS